MAAFRVCVPSILLFLLLYLFIVFCFYDLKNYDFNDLEEHYNGINLSGLMSMMCVCRRTDDDDDNNNNYYNAHIVKH